MGNKLHKDAIELWLRLEALDGPDSIIANVALLNPRYYRPTHLRPMAELLWKGETVGNVRGCVSVPPRHAKSETILHFIPWYLKRHPERTIAYVSHTASLAENKSAVARDLTRRFGIELREDSQSKREWRTKQGGGLVATGIGGPITGLGFHWVIVDDPFKNREEAESATIRQRNYDWITSTAFTRLEPDGNVLVQHTRWHDDDLIGRLMQSDDIQWEYVNLPALTDDGKALWPERWPAHAMEERKRLVGPYDWASLYQGQPRPKGGRLFNEPARYNAADLQGAKIVIACDPAASEKTSADYSAIVVLGSKGEGLTQVSYVLEVWRGHVAIPDLVSQLYRLHTRWNAKIYIEAVGGFKAVPQMLQRVSPNLRGKIVELQGQQLLGDKFTRALPAAAAWNDGRLQVPMQPQAWLPDFMKEIQSFTGIKDVHDDQVDALAHAYNAVYRPVKAEPRSSVNTRIAFA